MEQPAQLGRNGRKSVSLDIDGTFALVNEAIVSEYNAEHGTSYRVEAFGHWRKWDIPMTFPQFMDRYNEIWGQRCEIIAPTISTLMLSRLMDAHDVEVNTHRMDDGHEPYIRRWLDCYFPGVKLKVNIHKTAEERVHNGYDILFDDGPPVAEEVIRNGNGKPVLFLVERPWNKGERYHLQSPSITPVKTLNDGIERLLRIQDKRIVASRQKSRSRA